MKKSLLDLYCQEDALELCQGVIRHKNIHYEMINDKNVLDAAEVLLSLGDANNLLSKAALLGRALDYGWTPISGEELREKEEEELIGERIKPKSGASTKALIDIGQAVILVILFFYGLGGSFFLVTRFVESKLELSKENQEEINPAVELVLTIGGAIFFVGVPIMAIYESNDQNL